MHVHIFKYKCESFHWLHVTQAQMEDSLFTLPYYQNTRHFCFNRQHPPSVYKLHVCKKPSKYDSLACWSWPCIYILTWHQKKHALYVAYLFRVSKQVNECQFKQQYAKLRVMGYQNLFFFSVISQYFYLF